MYTYYHYALITIIVSSNKGYADDSLVDAKLRKEIERTRRQDSNGMQEEKNLTTNYKKAECKVVKKKKTDNSPRYVLRTWIVKVK